jgi:hypothetical protein
MVEPPKAQARTRVPREKTVPPSGLRERRKLVHPAGLARQAGALPMKFACAALLLGALATAAARAETVTSAFGIPAAAGYDQASGGLALFDSDQGQLSAVSLTLYRQLSSSLSVTGVVSPAPFTGVSVAVRTDLFFTATLPPSEVPLVSKLWTYQYSTPLLNLEPGQRLDFGTLVITDSQTLGSGSLLGSLDNFSAPGGGAFELHLDWSSSPRVIGDAGTVDVRQASQVNWGASISYTFDPSPVAEPGTAAMGCLGGLGGLGWAVLRRRRGGRLDLRLPTVVTGRFLPFRPFEVEAGVSAGRLSDRVAATVDGCTSAPPRSRGFE